MIVEIIQYKSHLPKVLLLKPDSIVYEQKLYILNYFVDSYVHLHVNTFPSDYLHLTNQ